MDVRVNSGLEMVALDGSCKGERWLLSSPRLALGRLDPDDLPEPTLLAFAEPTVSRVHALLEWEPRRYHYVLSHRSHTSPTLLNGKPVHSQAIQAGDVIQIGLLTLEIRKVDQREGVADLQDASLPVQTEVYLVVVNGPERGRIHAVNYSRLVMRGPSGERAGWPVATVSGMGDYMVTLVTRGSDLMIESARGPRPTLLEGQDGLVYERRVGQKEQVLFCPQGLLVCGEVAFIQAKVERAGLLSEMLRSDRLTHEAIHPLFSRVSFGPEARWAGNEEHLLRLLSGTAKDSRLWITPERLHEPLLVGPVGGLPPAHLPLEDPTAPQLSIRFEASGAVARNEDEKEQAGHNFDLMRQGDEARLVSGDRLTLGKTVVVYEHVPTRDFVRRLAVQYQDQEHPLVRGENGIGYGAENDVRIRDRRLGARHGRFVARGGALFYRHLHATSTVRVNGTEVTAGEEAEVHPGDRLALTEDIEVTLVHRSSPENADDPNIIWFADRENQEEPADEDAAPPATSSPPSLYGTLEAFTRPSVVRAVSAFSPPTESLGLGEPLHAPSFGTLEKYREHDALGAEPDACTVEQEACFVEAEACTVEQEACVVETEDREALVEDDDDVATAVILLPPGEPLPGLAPERADEGFATPELFPTPDADSEAPPEAASEAASEAPPEAASEAASEALPQAASEAASEAPPQADSEAASEAPPQADSEAASEAAPEAASEETPESVPEGAPSTTATAAEVPLTRHGRILSAMQALLVDVDGVEGVSIITPDGLPIASCLPGDVEEDRTAAMAAAMVSLGERTAAELFRGEVEQVFVGGSTGNAVMLQVGPEAALMILARRDVKLGMVFLEARKAIAEISSLV